MEKQNAKSWYLLLIKGIILVVLALFVIINPEGTLKTIALYLGIGFIIPGIILFIRGYQVKKAANSLNRDLIEGITDLLIGLILILAPLFVASVVPVIIGIWAVFYGIFTIIDSLKKTGDNVLKFLTGITVLLLANVLIFKPLLLGLTIVIWLGLLLLVAGAFNIMLAVNLKKSSGKDL
jgi:uncharacterized membrane protein HdeD (DUF308 family)